MYETWARAKNQWREDGEFDIIYPHMKKLCLEFAAFCAALIVVPLSGLSADYVVAVEKTTKADPAWNGVVEVLKAKHSAAVVVYDGNENLDGILPELKKNRPKYVCFVSKPETAGRAFVVRVSQLLRRLDDDLYGDALWGIITGYDAQDALRQAKVPRAKVVRRVASSMGAGALEGFDAGFASDEGNKDNFWRKLPGGKLEKVPTNGDPAMTMAEAFNTIDVDYFVTSGHGRERNWQIIYNKDDGYLSHTEDASLIFTNQKHQSFRITNACPKIYLAAGNCLLGHVDRRDCMMTSWMHSGGTEQSCGYTHVTFFGFMGWGIKSLLEESRCSFAEAFYLQNQLLLWILQNTRNGVLATTEIDPALFKGGDPVSTMVNAHMKELVEIHDGQPHMDQKSVGYLWDRDLVAFYGDPAYRVTFPAERRPYDISVKGGKVEIVFRRDMDFGSSDDVRSARPIIALLERPPTGRKLVDAAGKPVDKAVVTERFMLVPIAGAYKKGQRVVYRIVK